MTHWTDARQQEQLLITMKYFWEGTLVELVAWRKLTHCQPDITETRGPLLKDLANACIPHPTKLGAPVK